MPISPSLRNNITQIINKATRQLSSVMQPSPSSKYPRKGSFSSLFNPQKITGVSSKFEVNERALSPRRLLEFQESTETLERDFTYMIKKLEKMGYEYQKESERAAQSLRSANRLVGLGLEKFREDIRELEKGLEIQIPQTAQIANVNQVAQITPTRVSVREAEGYQYPPNYMMSSSAGFRYNSRSSSVNRGSGGPNSPGNMDKHRCESVLRSKWDMEKLAEDISEQMRCVQATNSVEDKKGVLMKRMCETMWDIQNSVSQVGAGENIRIRESIGEVERLNDELLEELKKTGGKLAKSHAECAALSGELGKMKDREANNLRVDREERYRSSSIGPGYSMGSRAQSPSMHGRGDMEASGFPHGNPLGNPLGNPQHRLLPQPQREEGAYTNLLRQNTDMRVKLKNMEGKLKELRERGDKAHGYGNPHAHGYPHPHPHGSRSRSPLQQSHVRDYGLNMGSMGNMGSAKTKKGHDSMEEIAKLTIDKESLKSIISTTAMTIKKFLGAMQRLQRAVAHKDSRNMEKFKREFESTKKELDATARECENKGRASANKKPVLHQKNKSSSIPGEREMKQAQLELRALEGKVTDLEYQKVKDESELKQLRSLKVHYQELLEKQTHEIQSLVASQQKAVDLFQRDNRYTPEGREIVGYQQKIQDLEIESIKLKQERDREERSARKRHSEIEGLRARNTELTDIKQELQEKLHAREQECRGKAAANTELQLYKTQIEGEIRYKERDMLLLYKTMEEQIREKEYVLSKMEDQVTGMKGALAQMESNAFNRVQSEQKPQYALNEEISALHIEVRDMKSERTRLETILHQSREEMGRSNGKLQEQIENLEYAKGQLEKDIEKMRSERDLIIEDKQNCIDGLVEEKEEINSQNDVLRKNNYKLGREVEEMEKVNKDTKGTREKGHMFSASELKRLHQDLVQKEAIIAKHETNTGVLIDQMKTLQNKIDEHNLNEHKYTQNIEKYKSLLQEERTQALRSINELEIKYQNVFDQLNKYQEENIRESPNKALEQYKTKISELNTQISGLVQQNNELKDSLYNAQKEMDRVDSGAVSQVAELQKHYENLKLNNDGLAKEYRDLKLHLTERGEVITDLENQNTQLKKDIEQILNKNSELFISKQEIEEQLTKQPDILEMQNKNKDLTKKLENTNENFSKLEKDSTKLQSELSNAKDQIVKRAKLHEDEKSQLKLEHQNTLTEMKQAHNKKHEKILELEGQIKVKETAVAEHQKLVGELKVANEAKEQEIRDAETKLEIHKKQSTESSKKIEETREERIQRLKKENDRNVVLIKKCEEAESNYIKELGAKDELIKEAGKRIKDLEGVIDKNSEEKGKQEKSYQDLHKEHGILTTTGTEKDLTIQQLKEEKVASTKSQINIEQKHKALSDQYSKINDKYVQLERDHDAHQSNVLVLTESKASKEVELQAMKEKHEQLANQHQLEIAKSEKVNKDNEALMEDISKLCAERVNRDQGNEDLVMNISEKTQTIQHLDQQVLNHQKEIASKNEQIISLAKDKESLHTEKGTVNNKCKDLESKISGQEADLKEKSLGIEKLSGNIVRLNKVLEESEEHKKNLQEHVRAKDEENVKMKNNLQLLQVEKTHLADAMNQLERQGIENEELTMKMRSEMLEKLNSEENSTLSKCKVYEDDISNKERELQEKSLGIEELSGQVTNLKETLQKNRMEKEQLGKDSTIKENQYKENIELLQMKLEQLIKDKADLEVKIAENDEELTKNKSEISEHSLENVLLHNKIESLNNQLVQLEIVSGDHKKLFGVVEELNKDLEIKNNEIDKLLMENQQGNTKIQENNTEIETLKNEIKINSEQNVAKINHITEVSNKFVVMSKNLQTDLDRAKEENEKLVKEEANLNILNLQLSQECEGKTKQFELLRKEDETRFGQLAEKIKEIENQNSKLNNSLREKGKEISVLQDEIKRLESEKSNKELELSKERESHDFSKNAHKQMKIEYEEHVTVFQSKVSNLENESTQNKCATRDLHEKHKSEIEKHQQFHSDTKDNMDETLKDLDTKNKKITELEKEIVEKDERIQNLEEEWDHKGIQFSMIEEDKKTQSKEISKLKKDIAELNNEISKIKLELEKKTKGGEELVRKNKALEEDLANISRKLVIKEDENGELSDELEKVQGEIESESKKMGVIVIELEKIKKELGNKETENEKYLLVNKDLGVKLNDSVSLVEEKDGKIAHLEDQIGKITSSSSGEKEQYIANINNYEKSIIDKDTQIHSLKHSIDKLNTELTDIQTTSDKRNSRIEELTKELDNLKLITEGQITDLNNKIALAEGDKEFYTKTAEQKKSTLEGIIVEKEKSLKSVNDQYELLKTKHESDNMRNSQELEIIKNDSQMLGSEVDNQKSQIAEKDTKIKDLTNKILTMEELGKKIISEKDEMEKDMSILIEEKAETQMEIVNKNNKIMALENKIENMQIRLNDTVGEKENALNREKKTEAANLQLTKELQEKEEHTQNSDATKTKEIKETKVKLEEHEISLTDKERRIKDLEDENSQHKLAHEDLHHKKSNLDKELTTLSDEKTALQKECQSHYVNVVNSQNEISNLRKELMEKEEALEKVVSEREAKHNESTKLTKELETHSKSLQDIQQKYQILEKENVSNADTHTELVKEMESKIIEHKGRMGEFELSAEKQEEIIQDLEDKNSELEKQNKSIQVQLDINENKLSAISTTLADQEEKYKELETQNLLKDEVIQEHLESKEKTGQETSLSFQKLLEAEGSRRKSLEKALTNMKEQHKEQNKEIDNLVGQTKELEIMKEEIKKREIEITTLRNKIVDLDESVKIKGVDIEAKQELIEKQIKELDSRKKLEDLQSTSQIEIQKLRALNENLTTEIGKKDIEINDNLERVKKLVEDYHYSEEESEITYEDCIIVLDSVLKDLAENNTELSKNYDDEKKKNKSNELQLKLREEESEEIDTQREEEKLKFNKIEFSNKSLEDKNGELGKENEQLKLE